MLMTCVPSPLLSVCTCMFFPAGGASPAPSRAPPTGRSGGPPRGPRPVLMDDDAPAKKKKLDIKPIPGRLSVKLIGGRWGGLLTSPAHPPVVY